MTRRLARLRRDDDGSALVLALVVVTVIGLLIATVLSFVNTGLLTTPKLVAQRDQAYDADGAVEGAINSIRGSNELGSMTVDGGDCGSFTSADAPQGTPVNVTCQGVAAAAANPADDQPFNAILALGTGADGGVTQDGSGRLVVRGNVVSGGGYSASGGGLAVYGDLAAAGNCSTGAISVTGQRRCGLATPDAWGADPAYPAAIADFASLGGEVDPLGTCIGGGAVRFGPGLYTDAPMPEPGCSGGIWWFTPGTYYFDFPASRATWTIGTHVVGGTLAGSDCDPAEPGVQFLLGGPTRFDVGSGGGLSLCGSQSPSTTQRIALTSLSKPGYVRTPAPSPETMEPGTVAPGTTFAPADQARVHDGVPASATMTAAAPSASATLSGFSWPIPDGSAITSVQMLVWHDELKTAAPPAPSVPPAPPPTPTPTTDVALTASLAAPGSPVPTKDYSLRDPAACKELAGYATCDVTAQFEGPVAWRSLRDASVTYTATGDFTADPLATYTANLDSVQFVVAYTPPGFETSSCTGAGCPILRSTTSQLRLHGTVYLPTGFVDVHVQTGSTPAFGRGVVVQKLNVHVDGSGGADGAAFAIPRGTLAGRTVQFTANAGGRPVLRAVVTYEDTDPKNGWAMPGRVATVRSWSVLR